MHECHGARSELVAPRGKDEKVEFAIEAQERGVVVLAPGFLHASGDRLESRPLGGRGAPRGAARQQALELTADLEEPELGLDVDVGDNDATARHDDDQSLPGQALNGLADRRPADPEALAQKHFRDHRPWWDAERDDLLFQLPIGAVGQRLAAPAQRHFGGWCFRAGGHVRLAP